MRMDGERVEVTALTGAALDWAVAQAIGLELEIHPPIYGTGPRLFVPTERRPAGRWWPSTDWTQGSQLLDRFATQLRTFPYELPEGRASARVFHNGYVMWQIGHTPLIALCRAVVAACLGEVVEVPVCLVEGVAHG